MSDAPAQTRPCNWSDQFAFTAVFRTFRLALDWKKILLAFLGILITYLAGRTLDAMWPEKSSPVVGELQVFVAGGGDAARQLVKAAETDTSVKRVGPFSLLLGFARQQVNQTVDGVLRLSPKAPIDAMMGSVLAILWLVSMHWLYAIFFLGFSIVVWGLVGGAICRIAAVQATRDEQIALGDAVKFSNAKLMDFVIAPLFPFGLLFGFGLLLFIGGLVGLIPWLGDLLVGLLFFLAIMIGMVMALLFIGTVVCFSLLYPTIAVENSDAFDAFSRNVQYIYSRPWKTALYMLAATAYSALCLVFVKLFVRITLWLVFACMGTSMNWAKASGNTTEPPPKDMGKLQAIWQSPSLSTDTQFIGEAQPFELSGGGRISRFLVKSWIYLLWGVVAAFAVSLYYSASTIIYLLLRQEVDDTDFEEVYLEELPKDSSPTPAKQTGGADASGGGKTSLPVIGQ